MNQAPMNDGQPEGPGSAAEVSVHVREVLEAAERAAAATVEQARAEGERRVGAARQRAQELVDERTAQISNICGDLLHQVGDLEARLTKLDDALATSIEELRGELERLPAPPADHVDDVDDGEVVEPVAELDRKAVAS